jgi:hypothetical protein
MMATILFMPFSLALSSAVEWGWRACLGSSSAEAGFRPSEELPAEDAKLPFEASRFGWHLALI